MATTLLLLVRSKKGPNFLGAKYEKNPSGLKFLIIEELGPKIHDIHGL